MVELGPSELVFLEKSEELKSEEEVGISKGRRGAELERRAFSAWEDTLQGMFLFKLEMKSDAY